jgi:hypothetical protein
MHSLCMIEFQLVELIGLMIKEVEVQSFFFFFNHIKVQGLSPNKVYKESNITTNILTICH